ncbi:MULTISPECIES: PAS domain-containing protein [Kordiimonas]|jgi:hypothetical protein|uniref:PAS domain-containing protein n=1 Tax=Kordiimonas TaxID=288021 RepID=UPI00257BE56A|nr:PAS domain-containing protein [Kordiimonas sp. UBA4487]
MITKEYAPVFPPQRQNRTLEGFTLHDANDVRGSACDINYFLTYFEAKTGNARLPRRADIVSAEIKHVLPNVATFQLVFEADGGLNDVVVLQMGSTLLDMYGELTGKSIFKCTDHEVSAQLFRTCGYCLEKRAPVVSTMETFSAEKPYLSAMVLLMPLSEDGKLIDGGIAYLSISSWKLFSALSPESRTKAVYRCRSKT